MNIPASLPASASYRLGGIRYEVERVFSGERSLPDLLGQEIISAAKRPCGV